MVSMQFAKNLAEGHGVVWNAGGVPVEGYSNPLWVLLMAAIHLLPIPLTDSSLYVKLLSLAFLAANLLMVKLLVDKFTDNHLLPLLAVFLTALYFPLNNWSLQGMEVGLEALLLTSGILLGVLSLTNSKTLPWMYVLLGLAVWLRMDAAAPALATMATFALIDAPQRRRHLAWGLGAIFGVLTALTIFRLSYYGEWLPNTYYLKLGEGSLVLRISIGLRRLWDFAWNSNWALFVLPLALLVLDRRKFLWPLFAAFTAQIAYSVYVGGDAWEHVGGANRFIAAVMPIFLVLFALTLGKLAALIMRQSPEQPRWGQFMANACLVFITGFSLLSFNT
jgi:hypothetical protein